MLLKIFRILRLAAVLLVLNACSAVSQNDIQLGKGNFQELILNNQTYTILNEKVSETEIDSLEKSFSKLIVVDKESHSIVNSSNSSTITLAYNGIYKLTDGTLVVGINNSYFKMTKGNIDSSPLIKLENFDSSELTNNVSIGENCKVLIYNNRQYEISESLIAEAELDQYIGILGTTRTFNIKTGKVLSTKALSEIDWNGDSSLEKREVWDYGSVYSLINSPTKDAIAVEINDEFRLAEAQ